MKQLMAMSVQRKALLVQQILVIVGVFLSWSHIVPLYELTIKTSGMSGELWLSGWLLVILSVVFMMLLILKSYTLRIRGAMLKQWHQLIFIALLQLVIVVISLSATMTRVAGYDDATLGSGGIVCLIAVISVLLSLLFLLKNTPDINQQLS